MSIQSTQAGRNMLTLTGAVLWMLSMFRFQNLTSPNQRTLELKVVFTLQSACQRFTPNMVFILCFVFLEFVFAHPAR